MAGHDWSELELDTALLSGANLRNSSFRESKLRWSVIDNADLSYADLRSADFTGVRLEETSGVVTLTRGGRADELVVLYDDRSVRRWRIHEGNRTTCDTLIASLPSGSSDLSYIDKAHLLFVGPAGAAIWQMRSGDEWTQTARFPSDNRIRRVAVHGQVITIVSEDATGRLSFSAVPLKSGLTSWTHPCASDVVGVSPNFVCGVNPDGALGLFEVKTGESVAKCDISGDVAALALREDSDAVYIGAVTKRGDVAVIEALPATRDCTIVGTGAELHESLATAANWLDVGLAVGGGGRTIGILRLVESRMVVQLKLKRELRCVGARVAGLTGSTERTLLLGHGARE